MLPSTWHKGHLAKGSVSRPTALSWPQGTGQSSITGHPGPVEHYEIGIFLSTVEMDLGSCEGPL